MSFESVGKFVSIYLSLPTNFNSKATKCDTFDSGARLLPILHSFVYFKYRKSFLINNIESKWWIDRVFSLGVPYTFDVIERIENCNAQKLWNSIAIIHASIWHWTPRLNNVIYVAGFAFSDCDNVTCINISWYLQK